MVLRYMSGMASVLAKTLQQAIAAHREGRLWDAEQLYRATLVERPNDPIGSHNLGLLRLVGGDTNEAVGFFEAAVRSDVSQLQFWTSYIDSLLRINRLSQARGALQKRSGLDCKVNPLICWRIV